MSLFSFGDKVQKARKAAERKNTRTLLRLMKDESYAVQIVAIKGLGKAGDASCCGVLLPLLKDPEFEVRAAAAEALGQLGDTEVKQKLFDCLKEEKVDFVRQALHAAITQIQ